MGVYEELKDRGLIAQVTDEDDIKNLINNGKAIFYIGFDPTADSLHVGHFMTLCLMKRLQEAGNKPIVLVGGGTGMIGDPSGRQDLRQMLTIDMIDHNCECFKKQLSKFIDFSNDKAIMINNAQWLRDINYLNFLRDIGPHFRVNRMLSAECYKRRLENEGGLTFLEFNYMLMQAYDFYQLFLNYNCNKQFGGDYQWSNMLAGCELIRRKLSKDAFALTIPLLTNQEGKKMGKTQKGAVWLDPNKTKPYEFYQYWRNIDDKDVIKCLKMLTFVSLDEIKQMEKFEGKELNDIKIILAFELTKMVHGEEEANNCKKPSESLFLGNADDENIPSLELKEEDFIDNKIEVSTVLVKTGWCTSKSDTRRNIMQGGISIDDVKITDEKASIDKATLMSNKNLLKKGRNYLYV